MTISLKELNLYKEHMQSALLRIDSVTSVCKPYNCRVEETNQTVGVQLKRLLSREYCI